MKQKSILFTETKMIFNEFQKSAVSLFEYVEKKPICAHKRI